MGIKNDFNDNGKSIVDLEFNEVFFPIRFLQMLV